MSYTPITREGMAKLKAELDKLQTVERPKVIKAIEEARAHGDLSENAEYHAAKESQAMIMSRIDDLQLKISTSQVVDVKGPYVKCVFGAKVTIENADTFEQATYTLVGPHESDPDKGFLSIATPIGKALLGLIEGDAFLVTTPAGEEEEFQIVNIS
ncbi:MAG: transcription elongation factor GreA [Deltaproteobacteria bacterium]|jgi:transcription elongation factor GreA|nr:transcription elongation factor GreA [Deltaproteobacteria bacterium]